uniref:tRNA (adenine(58)-N(1))-methyltransferase catalytic subunit TRMT61A n=1 Tax=Panagrellus redivivus TaxID=6233 RepID=A0A7E4UXW4_PANRE
MISTLSSSAEERIEKASFVHYRETVEENDWVLVYVDDDNIKPIQVKRGRTYSMKHGAIRHDYVIGKRYGSKITATAGAVYILRPNPYLWSKALTRYTQILYAHDISTIVLLLDIKPGSVICESGTGSGALTHALALAVGKTGHVYTHELNQKRAKAVEEDLSNHGLAERTTCLNQDACVDGFFVTNACDGVFLDLPEPWNAVEHAKNALSVVRGGRLVSFSPCIEQALRVVEKMKELNFQFINTIEVVPKTFKVQKHKQRNLESTGAPEAKKPKSDSSPSEKQEKPDKSASTVKHSLIPSPFIQPTHSGYLTSATLLPSYSDDAVDSEKL